MRKAPASRFTRSEGAVTTQRIVSVSGWAAGWSRARGPSPSTSLRALHRRSPPQTARNALGDGSAAPDARAVAATIRSKAVPRRGGDRGQHREREAAAANGSN